MLRGTRKGDALWMGGVPVARTPEDAMPVGNHMAVGAAP